MLPNDQVGKPEAKPESAEQKRIRDILEKALAKEPAERPDAEVFLRVSVSAKKGGWAALIRHQGSETVISGGGKGMTSNQLDVFAAAEPTR